MIDRRFPQQLLAVALGVAACAGPVRRTSPPPVPRPAIAPSATVADAAPPVQTLSREEALRRFRSRAPAEEQRRLEQLLASTEPDADTHALELVLFRLTTEELFTLGITQVEQQQSLNWGIAWGRDGTEVGEALTQAAVRAHLTLSISSCDLGMCGLYVPREDFFRARRALLASPELSALHVTVAEPRLHLR